MRKVIVGVLAVIGGLAIVTVLLGGAMIIGARFGKGIIAADTVLEADFEKAFLEDSPDDPLVELISGKGVVVRDVVEALEKAAGDARVKGLVARVGAAPMGMAQVQELRDAIAAFRASGKWTVAYAETFGEFGPGNGAYYLATSFDEIYLLPSGDVGLTGIMYESMFLRGTLEKLGVEPRMDHRKEYKNAMNTLTERAYTEAHREAMQKVMDSQFAQMVRGVAAGRGLAEAQVRGLFDRGPYLGAEAVRADLVDGVAYRDEVYEKVAAKAGGTPAYLAIGSYLDRAGRPHQKGETIALVYGLGGVQRGRSGYDPVFGDVTMGSDTVAGALRKAIKDDDVKAIVFRVDSPGGSYVASDAIWRETVRAKQAGKPVIVSMGNVAGSGGYFVAMAADKIVAQPGTITGSIGVLGGKMLTAGLWEKLGVSWDEVHSSANVAHVHRHPRLLAGGVGALPGLAGPGLRRLHRQGRGREGAAAREGGADRQGPYLERGGRQGDRPRRRARRLPGRAPSGARGGRPCPRCAGQAQGLPGEANAAAGAARPRARRAQRIRGARRPHPLHAPARPARGPPPRPPPRPRRARHAPMGSGLVILGLGSGLVLLG